MANHQNPAKFILHWMFLLAVIIVSKLSVYKIKGNLFREMDTLAIQKNMTLISHMLTRKIPLSSAVFGYNFLPSQPCLTIQIKFKNVSLNKPSPCLLLG